MATQKVRPGLSAATSVNALQSARQRTASLLMIADNGEMGFKAASVDGEGFITLAFLKQY
jgi:hypothetical protein